MFLRNHFQNAFVTHDIRVAMERIDRRLGACKWIFFERSSVLKTPAGPQAASIKVALAWRDGWQIELVEPVSGFVDHFRAVLPADRSDSTPRFHHIAMRRDDETAMRDEIQKLGFPIVLEGSFGSVVFIYVDAREALGHYLEYGAMSAEDWAKWGWPEDKVVVP